MGCSPGHSLRFVKVEVICRILATIGQGMYDKEKGGLHMKLIFKILTAPVTLAIDLFTLVCIGLISFSAFFLRLASGIVGILGILVLVTYSVKNGLILLTIAFLVSSMGLPMLAAHILTGLQRISRAIKEV